VNQKSVQIVVEGASEIYKTQSIIYEMEEKKKNWRRHRHHLLETNLVNIGQI